MPFPLLIPAIAALGSTSGGYAAKKFLDKYWRDFVGTALDELGIEIDPKEGINDATLTRAVNKQLNGTGVQIDSLLNKQKMVAGFERLAVEKIAADLGMSGVSNVRGLRAGVSMWLTEQVGAELTAQAGQILEAAAPIQRIKDKIQEAKKLEAEKKPGWNTPTDFTPAGISNRERQRTYRQNHKKHWIMRSTSGAGINGYTRDN